MAEIEIIKGADNGNPPDTLRQMYPKVNHNFQNLNNEVDANKTDADNKLEAHKNSTSAHAAQNITYSGDIIGASNVKQALDNTKQTIDDLILGSGDSGPEVAAARGGYPTLGNRLDDSDARLSDLAINIKAHGAIGDGLNDDTLGIQAALDEANSAGGGEVFIPKGQYRITSKLIPYPNVRLVGVGDGSEVIADTAMTGYMIENSVDVDNAMFENFCLNGRATDNPRDIMGFRIAGGDNVTFRSVNVYNTHGYNPFQLFGVKHSRVIDCMVDGNSGGDGIAFGSGCDYSLIQGCTARNVSDTSFVIADRSHYSAIIGCTAERGTNGQGNGIAVTSSRGVLIANNIVDGYPNIGRGIVTYADPNSGEPMERLLVIGNIVQNSHPGGAGALAAINGLTTFTGNLVKNCVIGIRISGPKCVSSGNHITASTAMDTAILLESSTDSVVMNNTVGAEGGRWNFGIRCLPGAVNPYVAFNVVRGSTSADYQDLDGSSKQVMNRFGSMTKSGQIDAYDNIIQETTAYLRLGQTTPVTPVKGDMYFDTVTNVVKVYDGATWKTLNWT
jgi:hypothetical protein